MMIQAWYRLKVVMPDPATLQGWSAIELGVTAIAAAIIGVSKTGIPGIGILAIPMMATVLGARLSVGALLPILILGDIVAVRSYRGMARWDLLKAVAPWVLVGIGLGGIALAVQPKIHWGFDPMSVAIGAIVLLMVGVQTVRSRLGERFAPHAPLWVTSCGVGAGFATTVANAAGPIAILYFTGRGLTKEVFVGSQAWYFLIFNLLKVPVLVTVTLIDPTAPMINRGSLLLDMWAAPFVIGGALAGKYVLHRLPGTWFERMVIGLAALGSLHLIAKGLGIL